MESEAQEAGGGCATLHLLSTTARVIRPLSVIDHGSSELGAVVPRGAFALA